MTWTLVAMTACYCLSVGPIVVCTLLGVEANIPYLLCFILYWFQVLAGLSAILSLTLLTSSVHHQLRHLRGPE